MYKKYLAQLEEAGKICNLKERSINCYKTICKTGAYGANVSVYEDCGGHLGKPQLQIPQRC